MSRPSHDTIRVGFLEKVIINFALPSDLIYHTIRALYRGDHRQGFFQRIAGLWTGKIRKYQKLLRVKVENGGDIPEEYRLLCKQTPCGKVRLMLAHAADA